MSRSAFARPGYAHRLPQRSHSEIRADWFAAIDLATALARIVERAEAADPDPAGEAAFAQNLQRLGAILRPLERGNFPVQSAAAGACAAAWLMLVRDWSDSRNGPETRTACAVPLAALTSTLDRILTAHRTEQARATGRMLGERDED